MTATQILFVDDEPNVLRGLRRMFFDHRDWEIHCAQSGAQAVEMLDDRQFDVLVTDMRMSELNGADLLRITRERHPSVIRIVLSGFADEEAALRSVGVAHQFVSKPCEPEVLEQVISRAQNVAEALATDELRDLLVGLGNLPPVPEIHQRLLEMIASGKADADCVAELVESDPALTAKLIQVVNSSFFANASPIKRTRDAVVRLGLNLVRSIVMHTEVFRSIDVDPKFLSEQQAHSVRVGQLAREMAPRSIRDDAFLAGLLHDVGKLVLAAADREDLRTDHEPLGAHLLAIWGMPYPVVDAVMHHHSPGELGPNLGVPEYVYCANALVHDEEIHPDLLDRLEACDLVDEWKAKLEAL